jgi:hypothetical protein
MPEKIWTGRDGRRPWRVTVTAALGAIALTLGSGASADAHGHKKLSARLLSAAVECDQFTYPYRAASGVPQCLRRLRRRGGPRPRGACPQARRPLRRSTVLSPGPRHALV